MKRGQQKKSSLSDILVSSIQHEFLLVHEDILFAEPLRHRRKNNVLVTAEPREIDDKKKDISLSKLTLSQSFATFSSNLELKKL